VEFQPPVFPALNFPKGPLNPPIFLNQLGLRFPKKRWVEWAPPYPLYGENPLKFSSSFLSGGLFLLIAKEESPVR